MKKLLFLCICLALFTGKGITQNVNVRLSKEELRQEMALNAPHLFKKYKTGRVMSGLGMGLTLGGVAAVIAGIASGDNETVEEGGRTTIYLSGSGAAFASIGTACILAGTPLWIIGGTKKRKAQNRDIRDFSYDVPAKPFPYMQLNAVRNGIGLAYVF